MKLEAAEKTRAPKVGGNFKVPSPEVLVKEPWKKEKGRTGERKGEKKEGRR